MTVQTQKATFNPILLEGVILQEKHVGNMRREFLLQPKAQSDDVPVWIRLDAESFPRTSLWMTVRGLRQLICPGVGVRVQTCALNTPEEMVTLFASHIQLVSILPTPPYLARLLSFPVDPVLKDVFDTSKGSGSNDNVTMQPKDCLPSGLVQALEPCTEAECSTLLRFCQDERAAGRAVKLWKHASINHFAEKVQRFRNPVKSRRPKPPRTTQTMWNALHRFEKEWCRPDTDGPAVEYRFDPLTYRYHSNSTKDAASMQENDNHDNDEGFSGDGSNDSSKEHFLIYGNRNVDPSNNLPDPSDGRRQRYIDERKRPQVQAMVALLDGLAAQIPHRPLRLLEIGGGRGYLAVAVTAAFLEQEIDVHLTVLDENKTSMEAAQYHAADAGLSEHMSFVLHSVECTEKATDSLSTSLPYGSVDIVYGLHCCGGLSEAAIELAIRMGAAGFCISTCCFRSNVNLASLSQLAAESSSYHEEEHRKDLSIVCRLATRVGGQGQHRAMRSCNAMRLMAAEERCRRRHDRLKLRTWQETFAVETSVQNRVMMGLFEPK